jgi:nucleotide-binding universal stress UspA family protein
MEFEGVVVTGTRIVVGVDGSPAAQSALTWAAREARVRQRSLLIVHCPELAYAGMIPAEQSAMQVLDDLGERLLAQQAATASAQQPGVLVTTLLSQSRPSDALVDLSIDADLVVVGSSGRGGNFDTLLGSVSHRVAVHAHCPVVLVPDAPILRTHVQTRRIVVGISSAVAGRLALEVAFEEAHRRDAVLTAVCAWPRPDGWLLDGLDPVLLGQWQQQAGDRLELELEPVRARYPLVIVQPELVLGDAADALVQAASAAELVVIGCHHSEDRWNTRLGPVPTEILHRIQCPVVVVGQQRGPIDETWPRSTMANFRSVSFNPLDSVREEGHNTEINTAAAIAHRCGMTHLASGRFCLLPERHFGSCDFRRHEDVSTANAQAGAS